MAYYQGKNKRKNLLYFRIGLGFLGVFVIFLLNSVWDVYSKSRLAGVNREITEKKLVELKERQAMLKKNLEQLSSEQGVEEKIREDLSVVKDNEKVITIITEEATTTNTDKSFWSELFK
jgi:cell division protein FtsB